MERNDARAWDEVQNMGGLSPNIKNLHDYNNQWEKNRIKVGVYLKQLNKPYLESKDIRQVHKMLFDNISSMGGQNANKQMNFGGGQMGSLKENHDLELKLMDKQMCKLWSEAKTKDEQIKVLAFQHTRFISIHPFQDGNGRVGRAIMDFAMRKIMNRQREDVIERSDYIDALADAQANNNIGRLTKVISANYNHESKCNDMETSPYRILAFRDPQNEDYIEGNSIVQELSSIKKPSLKNIWVRFNEVDRLETNNLKKSTGFDEGFEKVKKSLKSAKTLGESVEEIKKFKDQNLLKKKFLSSAKVDDVYKGVLAGPTERITRLAGKDAQETLAKAVEAQLNGEASSKDTDKVISTFKQKEIIIQDDKKFEPQKEELSSNENTKGDSSLDR